MFGNNLDMDFEIEPQCYIVANVRKVKKFIDNEIGVDYEVDYDEDNKGSGSITVFELLLSEHFAIRDFITKNELWQENEDD